MDFLQRLAASALGDTGSLRPALPPRFAPRTAAAPAGALDAGLAPVEGEQPARPADPRATTGLMAPDAHASTVPGPAHPGRQASGAAASARPATTAPSVTGISSVAGAAPVTRARPAEAAGASAHPHAGPREAAAAMQPPWPLRDAHRALGPRGASATPVGDPLAAPLEAAVVAAQPRGAAASPATAAAPVVHVVIERIDVRAPAPAPSRPPAAPGSLGEYLRGGQR
jgi:hypothetical protein